MSYDRHLTIQNLGLVQRQAGVDPEVAELVVALGRILVDSGRPLSFDFKPFSAESCEYDVLRRLRNDNRDIDPRFLSFLAAWSGEMERQGRPAIYTRTNLAHRQWMSPEAIRAVIEERSRFYRIKRRPKRRGGFRIIHVPRAPLRPVQKWIFRSILRGFKPSSAAHGFVSRRSIVTNGVQHQGRRIVMCVDIEDFFPSIKFRTVRKGFQRLGYPYSVAVDLANLCTLKGALPQGTSTSPALANLACIDLDKRLTGLARSLNHTYSRYADDLVFSSDDDRLPSILPFLREILAEEGFKLAEHKTHISRAHQRQIVNGIVVNERLSLPREHVRKLRAALHRKQTQGTHAVRMASKRPGYHDPVKVLDGHLSVLNMIHPSRTASLLAKYPPRNLPVDSEPSND
jgi:RNA-directed DNA polymerase